MKTMIKILLGLQVAGIFLIRLPSALRNFSPSSERCLFLSNVHLKISNIQNTSSVTVDGFITNKCHITFESTNLAIVGLKDFWDKEITHEYGTYNLDRPINPNSFLSFETTFYIKDQLGEKEFLSLIIK